MLDISCGEHLIRSALTPESAFSNRGLSYLYQQATAASVEICILVLLLDWSGKLLQLAMN